MDNIIVAAELHHVVEHRVVDDPLGLHDNLHEVQQLDLGRRQWFRLKTRPHIELLARRRGRLQQIHARRLLLSLSQLKQGTVMNLTLLGVLRCARSLVQVERLLELIWLHSLLLWIFLRVTTVLLSRALAQDGTLGLSRRLGASSLHLGIVQE